MAFGLVTISRSRCSSVGCGAGTDLRGGIPCDALMAHSSACPATRPGTLRNRDARGREIRNREATYPIRMGDIVACPAGGEERAHQIVNTGTEELQDFSRRQHQVFTGSGGLPRFGQVCHERGERGARRMASSDDSFLLAARTELLDYWDGNESASGRAPARADPLKDRLLPVWRTQIR